MRTVFMGTPDFSVGTLEAILASGHSVEAVFTQPDRPVGRKQELRPTPVKEAALRHGLPVYQPEKIRDPENVELLRSIQPDVIVVAAYGQLIPASILHLPEYGCLNVHASLLPAYRGAAPIQWAVLNGEKVSGVTIMQMDEGLDTGDMLTRQEVVLDPEETGGSLFNRLSAAGAELLVRTLEELPSGRIVPRKQPEESTTPYARMIRKSDGWVDWSRTAGAIDCQIRGLNPWPTAFTSFGGKQLKLWKASVREDVDSGKAPGTVLRADGSGILVQTGEGALNLTEIQMEGKKRMSAAEFLRGHRILPGELSLGTPGGTDRKR